MNKKYKTRLKKIFWAIGYLAMVVLVSVSGTFMVKNNIYNLIFVSGNSMQPTLNGIKNRPLKYQNSSYVDFGTVDVSSYAIDNIKRFDIVTALYPWDSEDYEKFGGYGENAYYVGQKPKENASYKIKRVIGLPGETLIINNKTCTEEYIEIITTDNEKLVYTDKNLPFTRKRSGTQSYRGGLSIEITLDKNKYFLIGDNWSKADGYSSDDCFNNYQWDKDPSNPDKLYGGLYKENITGVLANIEGYAMLYRVGRCDNCGHEYDLSVSGYMCPDCSISLKYVREDIKDKHYY